MRQVLQLAGEKVTTLHCWGQSQHFWQKWLAQPRYETPLIFILLTWPTSNSVGLKEFYTFRNSTYVHWIFFSFRAVHWFDYFGWSTWAQLSPSRLHPFIDPVISTLSWKNPQKIKKLSSLYAADFTTQNVTGLPVNWACANTWYITKCNYS